MSIRQMGLVTLGALLLLAIGLPARATDMCGDKGEPCCSDLVPEHCAAGLQCIGGICLRFATAGAPAPALSPVALASVGLLLVGVGVCRLRRRQHLSAIPRKATRCAHCTSNVTPST